MFSLRKDEALTQCDVLFVASPANFVERYGNTFTADKLHPFLTGAESANLLTHTVFLPGNGSFNGRSAFVVRPFPRISAYSALQIFFAWLLPLSKRSVAPKPLLGDHFESFQPSWRDVLLATKPKIVIGIGLREDLLKECKSLDIYSIEVQHGLLSGASMRDLYWPNLVPDMFFVWDEYTAEMASSSGIEATIVGHPYFANPKTQFPHSGQTKKPVAVALAYDSTNSIDPFGSLPFEVWHIAKKLEGEGYRLRFRIHPVMSSERPIVTRLLRFWLRLKFRNFEVDDHKKSSVRQLAARTEFMVTLDSSLAYEFAILGKKAVVIDNEARQRIRKCLGDFDLDRELLPETENMKSMPGKFSPLSKAPKGKFSGMEALLGILGERGI